MQRDRSSSQLRADLQLELVHLGKPLPGEGQRLAALKARSAIAARCQQAFQVSMHASRSSPVLLCCMAQQGCGAREPAKTSWLFAKALAATKGSRQSIGAVLHLAYDKSIGACNLAQ